MTISFITRRRLFVTTERHWRLKAVASGTQNRSETIIITRQFVIHYWFPTLQLAMIFFGCASSRDLDSDELPMRDFFHGRHRKLGCVTLLMALVVMVGWMRSDVVDDAVALHLSQRHAYTMVSRDGTLHLGRRIDAEQIPDLPLVKWFVLPRSPEGELPLGDARKWRWQFAGFGVSDLALPHQKFTIWKIPYWFPVSVLAVVSAWLLLSKPRPRPQLTPSPDHA